VTEQAFSVCRWRQY